jgi:hypothetical protein
VKAKAIATAGRAMKMTSHVGDHEDKSPDDNTPDDKIQGDEMTTPKIDPERSSMKKKKKKKKKKANGVRRTAELSGMHIHSSHLKRAIRSLVT